MHNAITHHLEMDTQPTSKQQFPLLGSSPSFILGMTSYDIEYFFG